MQNVAASISQKAIRQLCHKELCGKSRNKRERCSRLQNFADFCPQMLPNGVHLSDIGQNTPLFDTLCKISRKLKNFLKKFQKSRKNALQKKSKGLLYASCRKETAIPNSD